MPTGNIDKIIVLCLYIGIASLMSVLAFAGMCVYTWSQGEHVDGVSIKRMFGSVMRAIRKNEEMTDENDAE